MTMNFRYVIVLLIGMIVTTKNLDCMVAARPTAGAAGGGDSKVLSLDDGMIFRLFELIDCARPEDLPIVKELVGHGANDDYYRRANFAVKYPKTLSPFWHALKLLLTDKKASFDTRCNMLKILAGVEPDSRKKITIDGFPLHYVASVGDKSLVRFLLESKICERDELNDSKKTALFYAKTLEMAIFLVNECRIFPQRGEEQSRQVVGKWVVISGSNCWIIRFLEV